MIEARHSAYWSLKSRLTFPTSLQNYSNKPIINSIQLLSPVQILVTPWTEAHQASLPTTNSWSLLKCMSIELVMSPKHLILCYHFSSCLLSFPASGAFPMSWLFASGGQSLGSSVSATVLPVNILSGLTSFRTDWFDLLAVQGILESSPAPQFKGITSSVLNLLYSPTVTSSHDHWKNQSFDYMDLCWQSNVSA